MNSVNGAVADCEKLAEGLNAVNPELFLLVFESSLISANLAGDNYYILFGH